MKRWKQRSLKIASLLLAASCSLPLMAATNEKADWLTTKGNKIVDQDGHEVWLTGLSWFGYNTETFTFDGIWGTNLDDALKNIADHGFNLIRLPITNQLIKEWMDGKAPKPNIDCTKNTKLKGMDSLQVFDEVLKCCKKNGIKIMVDFHSARYDGSRHFYPVWTEGETDLATYHETIEWLADRYKNDDTIVAFDLENEPHGKPHRESLWAKWDGSTDDNNWKYEAELAAKKALDVNPNLLVMVEGIEAYPMEGYDYNAIDEYQKPHYYYDWWGGNLRGVKDFPVDLGKYQAQLVYSPHDYGPMVSAQSWFEKDFTKETLYNDCWKDNWAYIAEENIAPLLIGEWGGYMDGGKNEKWMNYLKEFIKENKINHTFWCYNPNSGDTGGLVNYDFMTWDMKKYGLVEETLWKDEKGKFVGLDHDIALGANGVSLDTYYGQTHIDPPIDEVVKGDVNRDNKVNSTDYALLKRALDGKVTLDEKATKNADVNADQNVDEKDLALLESYILGMKNAF